MKDKPFAYHKRSVNRHYAFYLHPLFGLIVLLIFFVIINVKKRMAKVKKQRYIHTESDE